MNGKSIKELLQKNGYSVEKQYPYKKTGLRITTGTGTSVFLSDNGKYWSQGKQRDEMEKLLKDNLPEKLLNEKVFVVYGRDERAKAELENFLRKHNIEPVFLDQMPSQGKTIIEKLEALIPECNYGIILCTPDDKGCLARDGEQMHHRVRQNVLIEMGMLMGTLKRSRIAVVWKDKEDEGIEKPSDIEGLNLLIYKDSLKELEPQLNRELKAAGFSL